MRTYDPERIPLINERLPHQIKLAASGGVLLVSCNCGMPPQQFHPEKGDDPRVIYDQWHENPQPRNFIRHYD